MGGNHLLLKVEGSNEAARLLSGRLSRWIPFAVVDGPLTMLVCLSHFWLEKAEEMFQESSVSDYSLTEVLGYPERMPALVWAEVDIGQIQEILEFHGFNLTSL